MLKYSTLKVYITTADKFSSAFSSNGFFKGRYDFDEKFTITGRLHCYPFS